MRIKVEVTLYCPGTHIMAGSTNPPLFRKKATLEVTPQILENLVHGKIKIDGIELFDYRYRSKTNLLQGDGRMKRFTVNEITKLKRVGWLADEKALEHYRR